MVSIYLFNLLGLVALGSSLPFVEEIHGHGRTHHSSHGHVHTSSSVHAVDCSHSQTSHVHLSSTGSQIDYDRGVGVAVVLAPPPQPGPPLCSCTTHCDEKLRSFTDLVVRTHATQIVCSETYTTLCCNEFDPWPGITDVFAHLAPCVPETQCKRPYAAAATDVRDFGVIGPCPGGFGVVRCLDGLAPAVPVPPVPQGPTHIVIPIIEKPVPPPPPPVPVEITLPYVPFPEPETKTTTAAPPQPQVPVVPPTTYNPPAPQPEPVPVPPPTSYNPPVPVPEPEVTYTPPEPVPEVPSGGYEPPKPVPVSTSYGVPLAEPLGELEHYYGYTSRFGYPYAYRGYYPGYYGGAGGLGFGKGFHFSLNKHKSFGFFG